MAEWPTVDDDKDHTHIEKKKVENLLKALIDDLKRYQTRENYPGTPRAILDDLNAIKDEYVGGRSGDKSAGYPGGVLFMGTINKIKDPQQGFTAEYSAWLTNYGQVIDQLYKLAGIQQSADDSSVLAHNPGNQNLGNQNGNQNPKNPTSYKNGAQP